MCILYSFSITIIRDSPFSLSSQYIYIYLISKGIVLKNHQSNGLKSTRKKNTPHTLAELSFPYICFLFIGHFLICYTQKSGNHIRKDSKRVL